MADSAVTGNGNGTRKAFTTPDELAKGPGNGFANPSTSIAVLRVAPDAITLLRLYCLLDAGQSESYDGVNATRHMQLRHYPELDRFIFSPHRACKTLKIYIKHVGDLPLQGGIP